MITKTTETAFRILLFLDSKGRHGPVALSTLSEALGGSPTYLAKIANLLVRGGVIGSQRGSQGGFVFGDHTAETTLLRVVEVCQGFPEAAYCQSKITRGTKICGYHEVMASLHQAIVDTLSSRRVSDLAACPRGTDGAGRKIESCRMCADGQCHHS